MATKGWVNDARQVVQALGILTFGRCGACKKEWATIVYEARA